MRRGSTTRGYLLTPRLRKLKPPSPHPSAAAAAAQSSRPFLAARVDVRRGRGLCATRQRDALYITGENFQRR